MLNLHCSQNEIAHLVPEFLALSDFLSLEELQQDHQWDVSLSTHGQLLVHTLLPFRKVPARFLNEEFSDLKIPIESSLGDHRNIVQNRADWVAALDIILVDVDLEDVVFDVVANELHQLQKLLVDSIVVHQLWILELPTDIGQKGGTEHEHAARVVELSVCHKVDEVVLSDSGLDAVSDVGLFVFLQLEVFFKQDCLDLVEVFADIEVNQLCLICINELLCCAIIVNFNELILELPPVVLHPIQWVI